MKAGSFGWVSLQSIFWSSVIRATQDKPLRVGVLLLGSWTTHQLPTGKALLNVASESNPALIHHSLRQVGSADFSSTSHLSNGSGVEFWANNPDQSVKSKLKSIDPPGLKSD